MHWLLVGAFVVSFVINAVLSYRIRAQRLERLRWKGFVADVDDSGLEQFDPRRYTPAGRRLYPWFVVTAVATAILFFTVFVSFVPRLFAR